MEDPTLQPHYRCGGGNGFVARRRRNAPAVDGGGGIDADLPDHAAGGMMGLPIFGDEAIYLRWAQLVRGEGVSHGYWWVSLADPKPPLHYWLLAVVFRWLGDPLRAGRVLSVVLAVISLPALIWVCEELGHLLSPADAEERRRRGAAGMGLGVSRGDFGDLLPVSGVSHRAGHGRIFVCCDPSPDCRG